MKSNKEVVGISFVQHRRSSSTSSRRKGGDTTAQVSCDRDRASFSWLSSRKGSPHRSDGVPRIEVIESRKSRK